MMNYMEMNDYSKDRIAEKIKAVENSKPWLEQPTTPKTNPLNPLINFWNNLISAKPELNRKQLR